MDYMDGQISFFKHIYGIEYLQKKEQNARLYASKVNKERRPQKYEYWLRIAEKTKQQIEKLNKWEDVKLW